MEAAITAARRGHNVILCEKSDHLAANLDYSKQLSFKKDIVEFLKSMMLRVQRTPNLELRLNTEVTEELILAEKPDVLIAACGAEPVNPPIPGLDRPIVHHITDLYKNTFPSVRRWQLSEAASPEARKASALPGKATT